MKPYILMTVYRRYAELVANLKRMRTLKREFAETPLVYLVWAQPEWGHPLKAGPHWLEMLVDIGDIDYIIHRPKLPLEGQVGGVTYPESRNLRIGMEAIKQDSGGDGYILAQTADVFALPGTYGLMDDHMRAGGKAFVYDWPNPYVQDCIATNFFAVAMDESYWPPLPSPVDPDVLEYHWRGIARKPGIALSMQPDDHFFHSHDWEKVQEFLRNR